MQNYIYGMKEKSKKRKIVLWIICVALALVMFVILIVTITGRAKSDQLNLESNDRNNIGSVPQIAGDGYYEFTEAPDHIGEKATVTGTVTRVFTSKSGTTFLNFCEDYNDCPFTAVIFASDAPKFENLSQYEREVRITGLIKSYGGRAEIIISDPKQIE